MKPTTALFSLVALTAALFPLGVVADENNWGSQAKPPTPYDGKDAKKYDNGYDYNNNGKYDHGYDDKKDGYDKDGKKDEAKGYDDKKGKDGKKDDKGYQSVWGQCGGNEYYGPTKCKEGNYCRYFSDWYSQCSPKND